MTNDKTSLSRKQRIALSILAVSVLFYVLMAGFFSALMVTLPEDEQNWAIPFLGPLGGIIFVLAIFGAIALGFKIVEKIMGEHS